MITRDELELLRSVEVREAIERNIDRDPLSIALDKRLAHAGAVATQVKYLRRARRKLPSYWAARCIVPPLAFEQSSSEECASHKELSGDSVLDLTCGLGVDALALSKKFGRVVAVERDEVLAEIARENFSRLGADNITVVNSSAEDFVEQCGERFDWCFADPDRRGADGSKRVLIEDCSPDMLQMIPQLLERGITRKILIKLSPLFDVDEAFRVFGRFGACSVEAVSLGDECKEVLAIIDPDREPSVSASAVGKGIFKITRSELEALELPQLSDEEIRRAVAEAGYLIVPDVALQKARLVRRCLGGVATVVSENGFAFASKAPCGDVLGRVLAIGSVERYEPRRLHRELKGSRAEILLRDVPLTALQIRKAAGLREGGDLRLAVTSAGGEIWVIRLK